VTLQKVEQFDANAEKAQAEADKAGEDSATPDPAADGEENPSGEDDPSAEPGADPGNADPAEVQ
jgi:hypothetical protein